MYEDLPYWVTASWDEIQSLEPLPSEIKGWDRDTGRVVDGPFVVEQSDPDEGQERSWLPGLFSGLSVLDDRELDIHSVRFDSSFKDHLSEVSGRVRWDAGRLLIDTEQFGTLIVRRLRETDRRLFGSDKPPAGSSITDMAKFFRGDPPFSRDEDES
jgi:hypothetical protein